MSPLETYLAEVERGLHGLPPGRRRLIVRELEAHLLDEAEARGLEGDEGLRSLLADKEPPECLAREIAQGEAGDATHRSEMALLAGALMGLATGGYLWLQGGWPWYLGLAFGVAHGFAVGTGIFLLRPRWIQLGPQLRLVAAILFGALLAIPLGFTSRRGFVASRLLYGAFTGYLVERYATPRAPWWPILEVLGFTALDFTLEVLILQRLHRYAWTYELTFNFILTLAVLGALVLRRALSSRWVLSAAERP